jgi:Arc/MetJ-type ribon-helix-helix transcriptional regulator
MTTISVPIPSFLEEFIKNMVGSGYAANKADVVRKALIRLKEEEAINSILRAQQEGREGKNLEGDLDELAKIYS